MQVAQYADQRERLRGFDRLALAARHPILELARRTAGGELARANADRDRLAESLGSLTRKLEAAESMRKDAVSALAHLAHDINNPLTSIGGLVDLVENWIRLGMLPEGREDALSDLTLLRDGCHRILHITNSATELSNAATGRLTVQSSRFDATAQSERIVRHMDVLARKKGLTLAVESNGPVWITSDHRLFDRILSNLVGNALKYTKQGSITVKVAREGGNATIAVTDTGVGIRNEDIIAIFGENVRGTNTNGTSGKGLGLHIAKQYTELMGGTIRVESEPGKGSVFKLAFPAEG